MYGNLISIFRKAVYNRLTKESIPVSFKRIDGRWYCDIDGWPDEFFANTLMVGDAHRLLTDFSQGADYISMRVKTSSKPIEGGILLSKVSDGENEVIHGATYESGNYPAVWLCPVTQFVLGGFPTYINFEVESLS